MHLLLG